MLELFGCKPITLEALGLCGFESQTQIRPSIVTSALGIVTTDYRVLIGRMSEGVAWGKQTGLGFAAHS